MNFFSDPRLERYEKIDQSWRNVYNVDAETTDVAQLFEGFCFSQVCSHWHQIFGGDLKPKWPPKRVFVGGCRCWGFEGCVFWSMDSNWKRFFCKCWSYRSFMGMGLWICRCSQNLWMMPEEPTARPRLDLKGTLQYDRNIVEWQPCRAYLYG